ALLDVGCEGTNIVISSPKYLWFRTFIPAGETFIRELTRELQLTQEQAGLALRDITRVRRFSRWSSALQPLFIQLVSESLRSITSYQKLWPDHQVRHVYGLGGAFQAQGLLRYLRSGA